LADLRKFAAGAGPHQRSPLELDFIFVPSFNAARNCQLPPHFSAYAIFRTRAPGGRIVAIGTTVVRALEHAADSRGQVHACYGLATQRIHASSRLRIVDAILAGTHEPGTSHDELLRAFTDDRTLRRATEQLNIQGYRTHEFGDSVFIKKSSHVANFGLIVFASAFEARLANRHTCARVEGKENADHDYSSLERSCAIHP
jgi:hypothetical protein